MGDIINYNIRGLKTTQIRQNKVDLVCKLLAEHNLKILNLQETRLSEETQIPSEFIHLGHLYEMVFCGTCEQDQGSGILIFVKKTEEIVEKSVLFEGRLVYLKIKNKVSNKIMNFFSFYGK